MLLPFDLEIRDRRSVVRAPVHDARRAVDPTPVVKSDKRRHHRADVFRVHREPQPAPVHRRSEQAKLVDDRGAHLLVPGLDAGSKALAAQLLFGRPLAGELLLDHVLGRDRGVIVAGQEQHLLPVHAPEARDQVVDRGLQRVAHVELARDVGRRKAHREFRLIAVRVRHEQCVRLPARVPAGLDSQWIERFGHLACHWACFIHRSGEVSPARWSRLARLSRRGYRYDPQILRAAHGFRNSTVCRAGARRGPHSHAWRPSILLSSRTHPVSKPAA